ncbi:hypothetical protein KMW28_09895 [Flammeovirga yaeyamensis]|uniref:Lipoprotein n=1 Tax=Flammeovirga yaeyamensis TaxID=367791 RepID=A0AAX1N8R2_9BACT|nr:hypothetical protein [Flammeovirga yaeyamensis]MBB3698731.1 hypothetical protein [Flammeovirga yaeyamensis]NMF37317.1 hypothetical protein [Flammeovirga yaeyamensis]QWG03865.1 hypothetical protein KMW28_09895 [Flammeovirga yaeyamensis]
MTKIQIKLYFFITLSIISFGCQNEIHQKEEKQSNPSDHQINEIIEAEVKIEEKNNSIVIKKEVEPIVDRYEYCDSLWKELRKNFDAKDSIINQLIAEYPDAPINNVSFLKGIVNNNDSTLAIHQPFASVFEGLDTLPFIFSKYIMLEIEKNGQQSYEDWFPENSILQQHDTIPLNPEDDPEKYSEIWKTKLLFPNAINDIEEQNREVYIYTENEKYKAVITSLGKQNSECDEGYVFYNFSPIKSKLLFSSPYDIELEYGNWNNIDSLIHNDPLNDCADCPHSANEHHTFAKLKGFDNLFFSSAGNSLNIDTLDYPGRELLLLRDGKLLPLWTSNIDRFGCSCL